MSEFYPVNDYGPLMPGLVMAGVAIVHVFLAQFAVGGGMLLCYFQWLDMTGRNSHARKFVDGYFRVLVLISFILGALTGVGIWFTAIQVSAPTIGEMVLRFHWLWATEWAFFCLEIVAGYSFYRYHRQLSDHARLTLLGLYAFAAWMSLFWINGILAWQLTPGEWLVTQALADGFLNPSFWPSLLFRTVVCLTLAGLVACIVVNSMSDLDRDAQRSLINRAAQLMIPMVLMPFLGAWYLASMPADSRGWVLGGSPAMMLFFMISVGASLAIGGYALIGLVLQRLYINGATASLLLLLAFGATAGGEFVREGSRKPWSIRHVLYSNGIRPEEVAGLRKTGSVADDPFPLTRDALYPNDQLRLGAKVFRRQCAVCHTMHGSNAVAHLTATWDSSQMRMNIAKLQHTKPFMPPFAGTPAELESLVQYVRWSGRNQPLNWPTDTCREVLAQIETWLEEAGTAPANPDGEPERHQHDGEPES
ncbi:MAG: cytochrome c [Planctomycetaceae bacterium]|nr:cytochrome c [Planctomycetaceae bacterium]